MIEDCIDAVDQLALPGIISGEVIHHGSIPKVNDRGRVVTPLQPCTIDEFVKCNQEPPDWIIEEVIYKGSTSALVGPPKLGKSFLALDLAKEVAMGGQFFNKRAIEGKVVYVNCELHDGVLGKRLQPLLGSLKQCGKEGNFQVISVGSKRPMGEFMDELGKCLREDIGLVILDPLYKLMDGDESDYQEIQEVTGLFDDFTAATGACILYVHHTPKGSQSGKSIVDCAAGSGVLSRHFSSCILLQPLTAKGSHGKVKLRATCNAAQGFELELTRQQSGRLDVEPTGGGGKLTPPSVE